MKKITCEAAVLALKQHGLTASAAVIAQRMGTSSRAVATALRSAVKDGRVTIRFPRKLGIALYRFKRLKAVKP